MGVQLNEMQNIDSNDVILKTHEKASASLALDDLSLSPWPSIFENLSLVDRNAIPDMYSIFTFEMLHNIFLGTSARLKELLFQYLGSPSLRTLPSGPLRRERQFSQLRTAVLRGCNTVLAVFQRDFVPSAHRIDFSNHEASAQLNGLYTSTVIQGMLEGKYYKLLDSFFPFVYAYVDYWLGFSETAPLSSLHTLYTDIILSIRTENFNRCWTAQDLSNLKSSISHFKKMASYIFSPHCSRGFITLKMHLLDHLVDDLERFGSFGVLSASPFEHYNSSIKKAYSATSKRLLTRTADTIKQLDISLVRKSTSGPSYGNSDSITATNLGLVRRAQKITLSEISQLLENKHQSFLVCNSFARILLDSFPADMLHHFISLVKQESNCLQLSMLPGSVILEFVQSGYVRCGFIPTAKDCHEVDGSLVIMQKENFIPLRQRVFGISWNRPSLSKKQSFVLINADDQFGYESLWVAKVLLLFRLSDDKVSVSEEYAYVQFMEVTKSLSAIDDALGCVCLRWSTDDETDHTLDQDRVLQESQIEVGEWFGLVPFSAITGVVQTLRSNISIRPFTSPLPWPLHRFYINRFFLPKDVELPGDCGLGSD